MLLIQLIDITLVELVVEDQVVEALVVDHHLVAEAEASAEDSIEGSKI